MTAILHVLDRTCDETVLQVLEILRSRSPDGHAHAVCSVDGRAAVRARSWIRAPIERAENRIGGYLYGSPRLVDLARRAGTGIVHAWGIDAARACSAALGNMPLLVTLINPAATQNVARWLRSFPRDALVAAGSQVIRTRLASAGVSPQRVVVIRGPVDFAAINRARESGAREAIAGPASPVLLMAGPPSRGGGQFYGLWAAAIVRQIHTGLRVILPYPSDESQRLRRFVQTIGMTDMLIVPPQNLSWAELVAASDAFVVPAFEETCTEPIGWAMAAGIPVVGSAVRSVAELIADRSNGLLCKAGQPRALASRMLAALEDPALRRTVTEVARGQAYEVFSMRQFCENYARVYENMLAGRDIGEAVRDTAMVA